jgi:hypothetical protein
MSNLLAARWQMALSLGFHILFASAGIALPLMMAVAEGLWLRTADPVYRELAKRWARGAAILFAVGAVSGTVLSFELRILHRGDLPGDLPVRLGEDRGGGALAGGRGRGVQRGVVWDPGGVGQRVDEHAGRVRP